MRAVAVVSSEDRCAQVDQAALELSSALIGLAPDDIAPVLAGAPRGIGEAADADRCTLIEFTEGDEPGATHHWGGDDQPPVEVQAHVLRLTWILERFDVNGEPVVLEQIPEGLPIETV